MADVYGDYMTQIAQARQDVGQRIAGLPQFETDLRTRVYGEEQAIPSLRGQIGTKIQELYDADKRAADVYANPQSPMYMRDPYQREKTITQQHRQELGSLQALQNMLAGRQDVLGSAIDKGLQIYKAGIEASQWQHGALLDELSSSLAISKARGAGGGGAGTSGLGYTDWFESMGKQPEVTTTDPNQIVSNETGIRWMFDEATGTMQPADYPGFKYDPTLYNMLNQPGMRETDVQYGEAYGAGYTAFPYKPPTAGSSLQQLGIDETTANNLQRFLTELTATEQGVFQSLDEVSAVASSVDPNLVYDTAAWNAIVEIANSKGIY